MTTPLFLARGALVLSAFLLAAFVGYAMASSSTMAPNYLGVRGLKRIMAIQSHSLFAELDPVLRWLAARIRPCLGERTRRCFDRQITLSGDFWGLVPEELVALTVMSAAAGAGLGGGYALLLGRGGFFVSAGALLGGALPWLHLALREQARQRHVQRGLPHVIDLLALALSAGLDFPGALRQIVQNASNPGDPLIEEIGLILQELKMGKTRRDAFTQFAGRVPCETVRDFVSAVVQAEDRGNPLGQVLQIQAKTLRERRSMRAEEAASRASVKLIVPLVMVFLCVLLLTAGPMVIEVGRTLGE